LAFITTVHVPVPLQAPPQPAKRELIGVAVRLTVVPGAKFALQVGPQAIPDGLLSTVPSAPTPLVTVSVNGFSGGEKVAVTL
jgi:hypothetical protein